MKASLNAPWQHAGRHHAEWHRIHDANGDVVAMVRESAHASLVGKSPDLLTTLIGARAALSKALPLLPADKEAVFCGEWLSEINDLLSHLAKEGVQS